MHPCVARARWLTVAPNEVKDCARARVWRRSQCKYVRSLAKNSLGSTGVCTRASVDAACSSIAGVLPPCRRRRAAATFALRRSADASSAGRVGPLLARPLSPPFLLRDAFCFFFVVVSSFCGPMFCRAVLALSFEVRDTVERKLPRQLRLAASCANALGRAAGGRDAGQGPLGR